MRNQFKRERSANGNGPGPRYQTLVANPSSTVGVSFVHDSYAETNRSGDSTDLYPAASPNLIGQTFLTTTKDYISKATLYLSKNGTPTGNIYAKIFAHTGVYGTSGKPTGSALITSNAVSAASLTGSPTLTDFTFSTSALFEAAMAYCVAIDISGITGSAGNAVLWGRDTTSPTHSGNEFLSSNAGSTFSTVTAVDLCFYIYGKTASSTIPLSGGIGTKYLVSGTVGGTTGSITLRIGKGKTYTYAAGSSIGDILTYEAGAGTLVVTASVDFDGTMSNLTVYR